MLQTTPPPLDTLFVDIQNPAVLDVIRLGVGGVDQWPWDADRVEVECWGSGAEQAHIYTIVVDGRRYGASVSFRDGTFRVPEQGAFGAAAELLGVELDEQLGGPG